MSATPRPWNVATPSVGGPMIYVEKADGSSHFIASVYTRYFTWGAGSRPLMEDRAPEALANADLIALAVNAHDALVAALRDLLDAVDPPLKPGLAMPGYAKALKTARAALKLAGAQP